MGAAIAAALGAGMALGWLADSVAGTSPIFIIVGLGLGIAGAVAYTVGTFRELLGTKQKK